MPYLLHHMGAHCVGTCVDHRQEPFMLLHADCNNAARVALEPRSNTGAPLYEEAEPRCDHMHEATWQHGNSYAGRWSRSATTNVEPCGSTGACL
jgi:hypothetical protein